MSLSANRAVARLMGGLDLLIDFATLGEYGLDELPADGSRCEGTGRNTGWEALAPPRRSSSDPAACRPPRRPRTAAGSLV